MEVIRSGEYKSNNLFKITNKKFLIYEKFLIIKKNNFNDIKIYYFLCVISHFIHLINLSGDFSNNQMNKSKSIQSIIKSFTCYNLVLKFNLSFKAYVFLLFLILLLFILRLFLYLYIIKSIFVFENKDKCKLMYKYLIIINHIIFLFFPYIIEYFSFAYYINFFPDKFIIKINGENKIFIIIIIIISTILIIIYNIDNYINIICINKEYTIINYDILLKINKVKNIKNDKSIEYKYSNLLIYQIIIIENLVLISNIENYLEGKNIIIFKFIISVILIFTEIILFVKRIKEFNYINLINKTFNSLFLFCFYSIIIDFFLFILEYRIREMITEIIITILKIFISYITYILYNFIKNKFFELTIVEILFKEKNIIKEKDLINSFNYLNQIIKKI